MPLLGPDGAVLPARPPAPAAQPKRPRPQALTGPGMGSTPWEAAEFGDQTMGTWSPWLLSPDLEINPYRDTMVSRVRDLVRNDGWASAGVTRILDNVIGGEFLLQSRPEWKALARWNPAFDSEWAEDYSAAVEAAWRGWAYDPGRWCDGARRQTMPQLFRLALRHELIDGESLAVLLWLPERVAAGRARYATALQVIDPDRLSNPQLRFDTLHMRGGVEIDQYGAPAAYHIRRAHMGDYFNAAASYTWDRLPRETGHGRPVVVHNFDADRAGQHRGISAFAAVLPRLKMLARYDGVELQAAVVNAIFAAYFESASDDDVVQQALSDNNPQPVGFSNPNGQQNGWAADPMQALGFRFVHTNPGEKIGMVNPTRPTSNYASFQAAVLRNSAAALGLSAEQLTQDWSQSNYSSARGALLEAWKTLSRRRQNFTRGFADIVFAAWLEEEFDLGELPMPSGVVPSYMEARGAFAACTWMGPPRGWIDPVKEAQALSVRAASGVSTLQQECSEQGLDYEKVISQRAKEVKLFREAGLPPPTWYGQVPASQDAAPPKPE